MKNQPKSKERDIKKTKSKQFFHKKDKNTAQNHQKSKVDIFFKKISTILHALKKIYITLPKRTKRKAEASVSCLLQYNHKRQE